jgi:hypothetical protein
MNDIKIGDLVRVVRVHECGQPAERLNDMFVVGFMLSVPPEAEVFACNKCRKPNKIEVIVKREEKGGDGLPIGWLEKVPPLDELEKQETQESNFQPQIKELQA